MPTNSGPLEDEEFIGTSGPDCFQGGSGDDIASGLGGDDELRGGGGNDQLFGNGGNDSLYGGAGDDELRGGQDDDFLKGGAGSDQLFGGAGSDTVRASAGVDTVEGGGGADELYGGAGMDIVRGGLGADLVDGGNGADQLFGGDGADTLRGGQGDDVLEGKLGNDTLIGSLGADTLRGGGGDDVLDGRTGADVLTGGGGADTFLMTVADGALDRITDLDLAVDQLDLAAVLPGFVEGDRLSDFVRLTTTAEGTIIAIDPSGGIAGFTDLVLIEGQTITSLSAAELGLPAAMPCAPIQVDTDATGTPGNDIALFPSVSADGRYVSFASLASDLVAGDSNGAYDVFVKDLVTGEITRVSTTSQGLENNGDSFFSAISADGRIVAFESDGTLAPGTDTNGTRDVYVKNLDTGETIRASVDGAGQESAFFSGSPTIDAAGELVGFMGTALTDPNDPTPQIYVKNLATGALTLASQSAGGADGNNASRNPELAADGSRIAYESVATNLIASDFNDAADIFVTSLVDGAVTRVSVDAGGNEANGASFRPAVSADGRFVAFESEATNLIGGDTNGATDIFVKDVATGEIFLVSAADDGTLANGLSFGASISADGRYVAFRSSADNLVEGDTNGIADVFVKDLQTGEIVRFEAEAESDLADPALLLPALSADGTIVTFATDTSDDPEGVGSPTSTLNGGYLDEAEIDATPTGFRAGGTLGDDIVVGSDGAETLRGLAGDDVLVGLGGADLLEGGAGSDRFSYRDAGEGLDHIVDFTTGAGGDVLDLSMVLTDSGPAGEFVELNDDGTDTTVRVDVDGAGGPAGFVDLVVLDGVAGTSVDDLIAAGNLELA